MKRLAGRVAIVTGAGGGIGREHALLLAKEGARVVVNDVGAAANDDSAQRTVDEIVAAGGEAVANRDAVGSFAAAGKIVQAALDAFGRLDVLINNAGILRDRTILKMSEEEWRQVLDVHLTGTFSCLQAAARVMKDQGTGGRIVNTTSSSGLLGQFGQANYGAAKAGIYGLTRVAAQELGKHQITVNAIAPMALTRMLQTMPGVDESISADELGPQFIAPLAVFLATDAASQITGQTFGIEGNQVFIYRMLTSHGVTRRGGSGPWTIDELGEAMQQVLHW